MIEKLRKIRYEKGVFAAVLTDLSKALDCISYQLLIAKLKTKCLLFWHEVNSFYFRISQKPKTENKSWVHLQRMLEYIFWFSTGLYFWTSFISDIYYRSFSFELWSRFWKLCWWHCSLLDMTLAVSLMFVLEPIVNTLFNWFQQNGLIANSGKSHFLTSPYERRSLKIHDSIITSSSSKELLRVSIDSELAFYDHITRLCSKANQKLSALTRVSKYMTLPKRHLLMSSYITSKFNYYPLIWIIHNRKLNKKINKVHKRALRIVLWWP